MRTSRGFTLVDTMVAVLILNVGLLGLVATAGAVTRMIRWGRTSTAAATLVADRLDALRADGCQTGAGSEERDGVTVAWDVAAAPVANVRLVTARVSGVDGTRDSLATVLICE